MRLERDISQKEGAFGILMAPSYPMKKSANPKHVPEVSLLCLTPSQKCLLITCVDHRPAGKFLEAYKECIALIFRV